MSDLISLADVRGYVPDSLPAGPLGAVWLIRRSEEPLLVRVGQESLAHMFEVFTLTLQTGGDALTAMARWREQQPDLPDYLKQSKLNITLPELPSRLQPPEDGHRTWETCQVSLLSRRDWLANSCTWPDDYQLDITDPHITPGEVPLATEHSCWVDVGFLFRATERAVLVACGTMPLHLLVTEDSAEIGSYLEDCREVDLKAYALDRPTL